MITLTALVLVFLLGHWMGSRRALKQTKTDREWHYAQVDRLISCVSERPLWTCTLCGPIDVTDTFIAQLPETHDGVVVDVQVQICSSCLRVVRLQT